MVVFLEDIYSGVTGSIVSLKQTPKGEEFLIFATGCAQLSSQRGQKAVPQRGKFFNSSSGGLSSASLTCLFIF